MFVYLITNLINGKRYIGQTSKSLEQRWYLHQHRPNCKALHSAIKKYGADNFSIEILDSAPTRELLGELEVEYIHRYCTISPNGYNLTAGGEGVINLPEEIRLRRRNKLKGNKNALGAVRTAEYCKQKSESQKGRIFSEETIHRMSESAKRRKDTDVTRAKKSLNARILGLRPPQLSSEELSRAGQISGHKRYHVNRDIVNPQCALCREVQQ